MPTNPITFTYWRITPSGRSKMYDSADRIDEKAVADALAQDNLYGGKLPTLRVDRSTTVPIYKAPKRPRRKA